MEISRSQEVCQTLSWWVADIWQIFPQDNELFGPLCSPFACRQTLLGLGSQGKDPPPNLTLAVSIICRPYAVTDAAMAWHGRGPLAMPRSIRKWAARELRGWLGDVSGLRPSQRVQNGRWPSQLTVQCRQTHEPVGRGRLSNRTARIKLLCLFWRCQLSPCV